MIYDCDAKKSTNRCPPASPELAMAGRPLGRYIMSSAEGLIARRFFQTK